MKKVGLITLYRGYNYGTSLQAYALKFVIHQLGYDVDIIWTNENAHAGRDIRIKKIVRMAIRMAFHPKLGMNTIRAYKSNLSLDMAETIKKSFLNFEMNYLQVKGLGSKALRSFAYSDSTKAIICGSDQIWSATTTNIEPLYYLRFAPPKKRIAYAPSFGADAVPRYNRKRIKKYLNDIPLISVREIQGARIVKELIGKEVPVVLDPTLLIDWSHWKYNDQMEEYILVYFLDCPSAKIIEKIKRVQEQTELKVIAFPYKFVEYDSLRNVEYATVDPKAFVGLVMHAKCVYTDSFHGTAFSINFNIPFYVFSRSHAWGRSQVSRIESMLTLFHLNNQYIESAEANYDSIPELDFTLSNHLLDEERRKSMDWLKKAIANTDT